MYCVLFRLSSVDVVVSLVLLAAQRLGSPLHPDWPRALQHRRGDWILCHHQDLLVVPHHGQHTRKCTHTHITQLKLIVEVLLINLQGELGVVGCCLYISSPVISCYLLSVCFCSGAASSSQQLPVEDVVEPGLQFPGEERSIAGSSCVLVADHAAVVLQAAVQDRGGREGRVRTGKKETENFNTSLFRRTNILSLLLRTEGEVIMFTLMWSPGIHSSASIFAKTVIMQLVFLLNLRRRVSCDEKLDFHQTF